MCPCKVCRYSIGGGLDCKENLEKECRDGGGYESFEPMTQTSATKAGIGSRIAPYILGGAVVIVVRLIVDALGG